LLAGCKEEAQPQPPVFRVKAVKAELSDFAPRISLTGAVMARDQSDLSFRVGGKVVERMVDVGDHVEKGQILARLDPREQEADVDSASAGIDSAEAQLKQSTASFERQKTLLATGVTTRREYDQIESAFKSAQAQLDTARSQLAAAKVQLDHTVLRADADGVIVARLVEAGQVVAQAQAGFTLARDGARDAVFNVHEWVLTNVDPDVPVEIALVSDPSVKTSGTVRDVAPAIDASTATIAVKVALADPPPKMTLGTLVTGTGQLRKQQVILIPWSALFEIDGNPAVWVVDPRSRVVSLTPVVIDRFTRDKIALKSGIAPGESVVTAGTQSLRPGQQVAIAP
jgi:RND family efflux transporter MFP subunit